MLKQLKSPEYFNAVSHDAHALQLSHYFLTLGEMVSGDRRDYELMRRLSQMTAYEREFPLYPDRGLEHAICAAATIGYC